MNLVVELAAATAHAVLGAVWLGAMAYSLAVVQPRSRRLLGQQRYEDLAATLAAGARWRVLALIAALALTGLAATALLALAGAAFVLGVIAARL